MSKKHDLMLKRFLNFKIQVVKKSDRMDCYFENKDLRDKGSL